MKRAAAPPPDPDDLFADTRMSFGEHIEDLRTHLLRAVYGFLIAFVIAIPLGSPILQFIAAPVEKELDAFDARYQAAQSAKLRQGMKEKAYNDIPSIRTKVKLHEEELTRFISKK